MGLISPTMPSTSSPRGGEELDIANAVQAILNLVNGNIDSANVVDGGIAAADLAAGAKQLFPQLASATDRKIHAGVVNTPSFAGNTLTSAFAHGLGKTPLVAVMTSGTIATASGTDSPVAFGVGGLDATNVNYRATIVSGSGSTAAVAIFYLVFG